MALCENVGMNIVDGRECGGLSHRWPSPPPNCPPIVCPPPCPPAATSENALAYSVCEYEVDPGEAIPYEEFVINSPEENITQLGNCTLLLQPGIYAVTFVSDAAAGFCPHDTDLGAALNLESGEVCYAKTLLRRGMPQDDRLTLNTILNLPKVDILTVINNTKHKMLYRNTSLTVIRLGRQEPR